MALTHLRDYQNKRHNEKAGTYSSDGNIPKIKGGEFIVGKFEDTLPDLDKGKKGQWLP